MEIEWFASDTQVEIVDFLIRTDCDLTETTIIYWFL